MPPKPADHDDLAMRCLRLENDPNNGQQRGAHPTMRDVAALAGVGVMTVSRVVNGRGGGRPEGAAPVLHATEGLDYRRKLTARRPRVTRATTATHCVPFHDM